MLSIEVTAFFEPLCREQLASFKIIANYLDERFFFPRPSGPRTSLEAEWIVTTCSLD